MSLKDETITEPSGEFAAAIRGFRAAVTHIAERETARPVAADWLAPARRRRRHQHRMILAWGCAAALCCATLPFAIPGSAPNSAAVQPASAVAHPFGSESGSAPVRPLESESSSNLLEQVDAEVSRSVPSSLAPLAEPENWSAPSTSSSGLSLDGTALMQMEQTNAAH